MRRGCSPHTHRHYDTLHTQGCSSALLPCSQGLAPRASRLHGPAAGEGLGYEAEAEAEGGSPLQLQLRRCSHTNTHTHTCANTTHTATTAEVRPRSIYFSLWLHHMYDCAAVLCPLHGRCSLLLFGCRRVARATAPLPARSHCTAHIDIVHTNAHASGWPCTRHGSVCLPCTVPCDWCCVLSSATPLPSTGFASFLGFFPHCTSLHSHHSTPALTAHAHSCACVALECYVLLPLCVCVCVLHLLFRRCGSATPTHIPTHLSLLIRSTRFQVPFPLFSSSLFFLLIHV